MSCQRLRSSLRDGRIASHLASVYPQAEPMAKIQVEQGAKPLLGTYVFQAGESSIEVPALRIYHSRPAHTLQGRGDANFLTL